MSIVERALAKLGIQLNISPQPPDPEAKFEEWQREFQETRKKRNQIAMQIAGNHLNTAAWLENVANGRNTNCQSLTTFEEIIGGKPTRLGHLRGYLEINLGRTYPTPDELRYLLATDEIKKHALADGENFAKKHPMINNWINMRETAEQIQQYQMGNF